MSTITLAVGNRYPVKMGNFFDTNGSWVEEMELMEMDESGFFTQYFFASREGVAQATLAPVDREDVAAGEYLSCTCLLPVPSFKKAVMSRLPSKNWEKFIPAAEASKVVARSTTPAGDDELIALAKI